MPASSHDPTHHDRPIRLLVVDDQPTMLRSLKRVLQLEGFQLETAGGGAEAIERLGETTFDGILIDVSMPGMNGVETIRQIRSFRPDVFVIFMTGNVDMITSVQKEESVAVLMKPFDIDHLFELIREASAR